LQVWAVSGVPIYAATGILPSVAQAWNFKPELLRIVWCGKPMKRTWVYIAVLATDEKFVSRGEGGIAPQRIW
jgi:hypothetical protein